MAKWIKENKWLFVTYLCGAGMLATYGGDTATFATFSAIFVFALFRAILKV
tara:strand:+ start:15934 stop:16086 length:153 start_codon:yes stop_codon:yes gene_type:complete